MVKHKNYICRKLKCFKIGIYPYLNQHVSALNNANITIATVIGYKKTLQGNV